VKKIGKSACKIHFRNSASVSVSHILRDRFDRAQGPVPAGRLIAGWVDLASATEIAEVMRQARIKPKMVADLSRAPAGQGGGGGASRQDRPHRLRF